MTTAGPGGDGEPDGTAGPGGDGEPIRTLPPVTERELAARRRGLASAYIPGGEDPEMAETRRRERRYVRLLIAMIVLIVGIGMFVTILGLIVAGPAG